jgi:hypothetical protein
MAARAAAARVNGKKGRVVGRPRVDQADAIDDEMPATPTVPQPEGNACRPKDGRPQDRPNGIRRRLQELGSRHEDGLGPGRPDLRGDGQQATDNYCNRLARDRYIGLSGPAVHS